MEARGSGWSLIAMPRAIRRPSRSTIDMLALSKSSASAKPMPRTEAAGLLVNTIQSAVGCVALTSADFRKDRESHYLQAHKELAR
jgi:hypothetical protein